MLSTPYHLWTTDPHPAHLHACDSLENSFVMCGGSSSPFPDIAPEDSVLETHLLPSTDKVGNTSSHSVEVMTLLEPLAGNTPIKVYYKKCDGTYPSSLAQIEAAVSASARLTRGNRFARIRTVRNSMGFVIGSISYGYTDFKPINQCTLTLEDLIRLNAAESFVNRYVKEDDDFHPGNAGIAIVDVFGGEAWVEIDGDMFYYRKTAEIKGARVINNGFIAPHPANAFPKTVRDVENFPNIQDQKPCYWPTNSPANYNLLKEWKQKELFRKLENHPDFVSQAYAAFLQEAMICREMHEAVVPRQFTKDPDGLQSCQEHLAYITKLHDDFAALLPHSPKFRNFLMKNPHIYAKICQTFSQNLETFPHLEPIVKRRFFDLVRRSMITDLTMELFHIGGYLSKPECNSGVFHETYHRLLDFVQQFHEDPNPFETALNQLEAGLFMLKPVLSLNSNKEWSLFVRQFSSCVNRYRRFCGSSPHAIAESIYMRRPDPVTNMPPLDDARASKAIAQETFRWLESQDHVLNALSIVKECVTEYSPYLGMVNPKSLFRVRRGPLENLISQIEQNQREPRNVIGFILEFLKEGAWNPPGRLTGASANVLLIYKLAAAAMENFKGMLSPKLLKNHEIVQVFFLIQNEKWKVIDHVQDIAKELKVIHLQ